MFQDPPPTEPAPRGIVLAQASLAENTTTIWLVQGENALPLQNWAEDWPCARFSSVAELIRQWAAHQEALRRLIELPQTAKAIADSGVSTGALRLESPVQPQQLFCTIGNYRRQVVQAALDSADPADAELVREATTQLLDERRRDGDPYICLTTTDRVASPRGELVVDLDVDTLDWEVEIGAVIGGSGSRLTPSEAQAVVAGYCVVDDLTIRSRVVRSDLPGLGSDWLQCKGLSGSLPVGPWFVPVWQIPDPSSLRLQLSLNGTPMQDDVADDMVFTIPEQLAYLSQHVTLRPGDLLCTGSPAGFGTHHGRFLGPGDTITASVTGLGEQSTRIVGPTTPPDESTLKRDHPNYPALKEVNV
jgi:2,4-diketo-3-deoxy-L-fuconate hydrolase